LRYFFWANWYHLWNKNLFHLFVDSLYLRGMIRNLIMHTPLFIGPPVIVLICGVLVGASLIWRSGSLDWAAFASLGLLIGMVIGLSKSPVVAGAIAGALSLITTLVPRFLDRSEQGRPVGHWLFPLSLCAVLGLLAGIIIRTNDLLTFKQVHYPRLFEKQWFNAGQIETLMNRLAVQTPPVNREGSSLLGREQTPQFSSLWQLDMDSDKLLEQIEHSGSSFEKTLIETLRQTKIPDEAIVKGIKTMLGLPVVH
jgi:hypothetical protein